GNDLMIFGGLILLTMSIIHFLPKLTSAFPSSLAAILVVSFLVIGLDVNTNTVGDLASIQGGFPAFHLPSVPFNMETFKIILPYAIILAAVGLIESLLTLTLIDDITGTRGRGNRECMGQGIANTVTGFFGGMGGCAMIGQSMINIKSGGRTRLSGIAAALFLLAFILWGSGLIEQIPLAALVGVMFMVVIGTFAWSSLTILHKVPRNDAFVIILVTAVTVYTDLAMAVVVGVIVSALDFSWKAAKRIDVKTGITPRGRKIYHLTGPLFFGSTANFQEMFNPKDDPDHVVVDFAESRVWDHSGLQAIDALAERYTRLNKILHLRHLSPDCDKLLVKAGSMVEHLPEEDPDYGIAVNYGEEFTKP
ncbi:MAG: SulP family inorganic anion transporter, partial [Sphingomonadales bacterium]|nr:SulP family inorganic anion transporter [Sphingomonadales bacterium]